MKRRERLLAILAVAVLALVVADRLVLGPVTTLWKGLNQRLAVRRAELTAARELVSRSEDLRARYQALATSVEEEAGTRESTFLAFLHTAAGSAGLEIVSERPARAWHGGRGPGTLRYAETTVSLTFTCSMEALVRFLYELEVGQEPVRVRQLRVTSLDPAGRALEVSVRLSTVVLPPVEKLAKRRGGQVSPRSPSRTLEASL